MAPRRDALRDAELTHLLDRRVRRVRRRHRLGRASATATLVAVALPAVWLAALAVLELA
jgi:hypothetical protein